MAGVILPTEAARLAERRRGLDTLEAEVVRRHLARPDADAQPIVDALRYVLSFARLTTVRNWDGVDVDVIGLQHLHAIHVEEVVERRLAEDPGLWRTVRALPDLVRRTRQARQSLLEHLPIDRESLEEEVTTRLFAVVSGGGGGSGYVYPGCYELLDRHGLAPDLMVGTSIGALMSMFRARRHRYDPAPMVEAGRRLAWSKVFRVLESESRYGVPATLRLYLRSALEGLFRSPSDGRTLTLGEMEIPLFVIATGLTVDAFRHDLEFYEHLLDPDVGGGAGRVRGMMKTATTLREFLARPDALVELVLGASPGTEDFDTLDAAGFSAAVPGVIHYDVLRPDERMRRLLDDLYARYGITRLGEGGLVANVPARAAWELAMSGRFGRRNLFTLALDCFAPRSRNPLWLTLQQIVRTGNVERDRKFAELYLPFSRVLSPMNLVPSLRDLLTAMRWGREQLEPHLPFVTSMMAPIPVLRDDADPRIY